MHRLADDRFSQDRLVRSLVDLGYERVPEVAGRGEFSRRGGIIQFIAEGGRVRFEINLASAESARLVLSSELLKVAATVRRSSGSGD